MSKILIIDDESCIRIPLQRILEGAGYEVSVAADAPEAMEVLATSTFDVVVTDIIMPDFTGIQVLESIKISAPQTQVILMTGLPDAEASAQLLRMGAFHYLAKPFGKDALLNVVADAIKTKESER